MSNNGRQRPDWDQYFLEIAHVVAKRSTCMRRQIGAVIVRDRRILTTGYNGAPSGLKHCIETGCLRDELGIESGTRHEMCRALHSEMNAVIQAAQHGVSTRGATIYSTRQPCSVCARMIINAGIIRVVYTGDYPDDFSAELLHEAEVELVRIPSDAEAEALEGNTVEGEAQSEPNVLAQTELRPPGETKRIEVSDK